MTPTVQQTSPLAKFKPWGNTFNYQFQLPNIKSAIVTPYLPMTTAEAKQIEDKRTQQAEEAKAKKFAQYQKLLAEAKKAGIPTYEIDSRYKDGQDLSGIKIKNHGLIITDYNLGKYEMFDGREFNCVKMERIITYPQEKRTVTLCNDRKQEYEGEHTSSTTISLYAKDEKGKTYKCNEIKYIEIGQEPNFLECNYYNPNGTKSNESYKGWQMKK